MDRQGIFDLYYQVLATLQRKSGELFDEFADEIQCKKGCSGCCINGFKVRYIEGLNLLNGFAEAKPETAKQIMENLSDSRRMACPVLVNGECALYDHRPSLCRAYGVVIQLNDALATCNLNFKTPPNPAIPIKSLDILPYYEVIDDLSQEAWSAQPLKSLSQKPLPPGVDIRTFLNAFIHGSQQTPSSHHKTLSTGFM